MATNAPHPTARALVEAYKSDAILVADEVLTKLLAGRIADALTAAHDAGRREALEEAAVATETLIAVRDEPVPGRATGICIPCRHHIAKAIRNLVDFPLDDAARGEEPSDG